MLLEKRWIQIMAHRHFYSFSLQLEMGFVFGDWLCRLFAWSRADKMVDRFTNQNSAR
jgi:hypothetical protein